MFLRKRYGLFRVRVVKKENVYEGKAGPRKEGPLDGYHISAVQVQCNNWGSLTNNHWSLWNQL